MTGRGSLTHAPNRRLRVMITALLTLLFVIGVLGVWWGSTVIRQAQRIYALEQQVGISGSLSPDTARRMIYSESAFFLVILVGICAFLVWFYARDFKRTKSLSVFFASVTHELRTPLTSIRLQAESIADNIQASQDADPILIQRLLEDTNRLESQVERTLELARVEGGGSVFIQNLEIDSVFRRIVRMYLETHPGQFSEISLPQSTLTICADPTAVQVILKNLLENSLRHAQVKPVRVVIEARKERDSIWISYRDFGGPIKDQLVNLGEVFAKGAHSSGAGVGLYLVKTLMSRMNGEAHFAPRSDGFETRLRFDQGGE